MLGRFLYKQYRKTVPKVSKPYRYARKAAFFEKLPPWWRLFQNLIGMLGSLDGHTNLHSQIFVSKPYRYARKLRRERMKITIRQFQNLIGMLGSWPEEYAGHFET